jgi:cytochrome subunit of sulfide dehydrogenase
MTPASLLSVVVFVLSIGISSAKDAPAGASACSGCHASNAAAETPVPRIDGMPAAQTIAAMDEFRTGKRPSTVMNRIAKGFTEDETRAIADWLAEQKQGAR